MAVIVGRGAPAGDREQPLLHERHLLDRQLDAEVAARDHDAVGRVDDLLAVGRRLRLLDLGDQGHVRAAGGEVLAHRVEVLAAAHEREREVVQVHLEACVDQRDVLRAHGRQRHRHVGQVEALPRRHAAADLDVRDHVGADHLEHAQPHRAVGEVADVAGLDQLGEPAPGHRQPFRRPLDRLRSQHHARAARQLSDAAGHRAEPQLRARQVAEDGHLAPRALGRLPDPAGLLGVLVPASVGEVQPRDVHPRDDHRGQDVGLLGGRTDGCDDLRCAHFDRLGTYRAGQSRKARS